MKKSRLSGQSTYSKAMMKLYGHMVLLMTWDLPALAHGHIPGADAPYPRKSARLEASRESVRQKVVESELSPPSALLITPDFRQALFLVIPLGFEPKTHSLEGCCSIQLSYGTDPFAFCHSKLGGCLAGRKVCKYKDYFEISLFIGRKTA